MFFSKWVRQVEAAIITAQIEDIRRLFRFRKWMINQPLSYVTPSLHFAAMSGNTEAVAALLSLGASVRTKLFVPADGETPLHLAANVAVAELLISHGADVNAKDNTGRTPLDHAIENGSRELVKLLIDHGAIIRYSIHTAAFLNDVNMLNKAMANGEQVDALDWLQRTPLHWTALGGDDCDTADVLIDHNANIDALNNRSATPLHLAAAEGREHLVSLFINSGADITSKDNRGNIVLLEAIVHNWTDIVKVLLEAGIPANMEKNMGYSPLHFAAHNGFIEIARILMEYGADVNAIDRENNTPLHEAIDQEHPEMVELLVANGAIHDI